MSLHTANSESVGAAELSQSLGVYLRELRQAQGLSFEEASNRTKYAPLQLAALEQEQWDSLPSGTPLGWMVKSYGRFLGADEALLLGLLGTDKGALVKSTRRTSRREIDTKDAALYADAPAKPRMMGWFIVIAVLLFVALFYALNQGLIPEEWLVFDWLKEFKS